MRHQLPGVRPDTLMGYLAALGLGRVLAQTDPSATTWWHEGVFVAETECADLVDFLVRDYRPTPVVSPWNGGSGYGPKDKKQREAVVGLASTGSDRLAAYARTHEVARQVVADADAHGWVKQRVVQEMRNRCPDEVVPWIDTTVVLTSTEARFPPLAGTGGNDGRLEFSSNFHQRLSEVLPELGAHEQDSRSWVGDLMRGTSTHPLKVAAAGQFDGLAAGGPGSWSFGSADSLVNPWTYVLMVEGMMRFAAAPAKRLGEAGSRAAIPFTVPASAEGPRPGAHGEASRGEVWAPVWARPLTGRDVGLLFSQAKASWDGDAVRNSAHMYAAVRSFGVDRRVSRFLRFGLAQRNGLAFVAVLLDEVRVHTADGIDLAVPVERRMRAFRASDGSPAGVRRVLRAYEHALHTFVRDVHPDALVGLLASATRAQLVFARSSAARDSVRRCQPRPPASTIVPFLEEVLARQPELRVGAALASTSVRGDDGTDIPLSRLLAGSAPERGGSWAEAKVRGLGHRPLTDVLADAAIWVDQHVGDSPGVGRGVRLAARRGYACAWQDAHAWLVGDLDAGRVEEALLAFLALDWSGTRLQSRGEPGRPTVPVPVPALTILSAFAAGVVVAPLGDPALESDRRGLARGWPLRLRAGQTSSVVGEATALLNRASAVPFPWTPPDPERPRRIRAHRVGVTPPLVDTAPAGPALLAALWLPFHFEPFEMTGATVRLGTSP